MIRCSPPSAKHLAQVLQLQCKLEAGREFDNLHPIRVRCSMVTARSSLFHTWSSRSIPRCPGNFRVLRAERIKTHGDLRGAAPGKDEHNRRGIVGLQARLLRGKHPLRLLAKHKPCVVNVVTGQVVDTAAAFGLIEAPIRLGRAFFEVRLLNWCTNVLRTADQAANRAGVDHGLGPQVHGVMAKLKRLGHEGTRFFLPAAAKAAASAAFWVKGFSQSTAFTRPESQI